MEQYDVNGNGTLDKADIEAALKALIDRRDAGEAIVPEDNNTLSIMLEDIELTQPCAQYLDAAANLIAIKNSDIDEDLKSMFAIPFVMVIQRLDGVLPEAAALATQQIEHIRSGTYAQRAEQVLEEVGAEAAAKLFNSTGLTINPESMEEDLKALQDAYTQIWSRKVEQMESLAEEFPNGADFTGMKLMDICPAYENMPGYALDFLEEPDRTPNPALPRLKDKDPDVSPI